MIYTADPTQPPMAINDRHQSLLPANSRPLEHALAGATAKLEPIPVPFDTIWDVDTAPDSLLPYLAYAWSVDEWNDNWVLQHWNNSELMRDDTGINDATYLLVNSPNNVYIEASRV